jgi:apolipoprotein N-acyltransferase
MNPLARLWTLDHWKNPILGRFWLPAPTTLVSAVLYVAAFAPWDVSSLTWIALVPFLIGITDCSLRASLWQSFWMGMLITLLGFPWVAYVLAQFGELPLWLGVIGLVLFGLVCQPQFWILGPVWARLTRRSQAGQPQPGAQKLIWIGFAFFYAGVDWILPKLFVDTLGHAFYRNEWIRQGAELGGPPLLTWVAVLWNSLLARWIFFIHANYHEDKRRPILHSLQKFRFEFGLVSTLCLVLLGFGQKQFLRYQSPKDLSSWDPSQKVKVGVIQANIGDYEKVAAETGARGAADRILGTYFQFSDASLNDPNGRPDFLLWPETAYPTTFRSPRTPRERHRDLAITDYVQAKDIPLLFGGYDREDPKEFNSLFILVPPSMTHLEPPHDTSMRLGPDLIAYHKNLLLLFGETMPFSDQFPILNEWFPQVGNFGKGPGPEVFPVPMRNGSLAPRVAPIICYEALFTRYTVEAARQKAQLLVNVTNDSWFGPFGEPELHLALSTFRSIETRLPQIRATNTGISALILPDGTIAGTSPKNEALHLNWDIPLRAENPPTLIVRWGDWFGPSALFLGILCLLTGLVPRSLFFLGVEKSDTRSKA